MAWSKSLKDKTLEMIESMDAYGAFFKNLSGEHGQLMPKDGGYQITLFAETNEKIYPSSLSEKKYFFKNPEEIINAGWVID